MTSSKALVLVADGMEFGVIQTAAAVELLGFQVRIAVSETAALEILRRNLISIAFVGVELTLDDELLLSRVSALPLVRWLVALGPGCRSDLEFAARRGGANVYLQRPVGPEQAARSLGASDSPPQRVRAP